MTDFHLIGNETVSDVTEPSVVELPAQMPTTPMPPATPELSSSASAEDRTAPETSTVEKAPASSPKRAAARKPAAKKVAKPKSAKPVASKSPAKKAAAKKSAVKATTAKKSTAKKAAAKPAAKKAAVKKAIAKKTVARKAVPKKSGPLKARVAPPQVPKAAAPVAPAKPVKAETSHERAHDAVKAKSKLVRDSFTMPEQDFGLIAGLKERALDFKRPTKKSELLRAGLHALQQLGDAQLRGALDSLTPLKAGRPKKKGN
jgi:hypothetical protein